MKSREEVLEILAAVKPELQKEFKVRRIGLFGSYARMEQRPDSDVDVLVEVDPSIGLEFVTLAERIEKRVGLRTEVVSSRAIKPRHRKLIKREVIYV
ncbi:MAG: nucleotidyltransferase family protein [Syntrophorhabdales bacterium]